MDTVELIVKAVSAYHSEIEADPNGRYRSWEHCYKAFHDARGNQYANTDYLSLMLSFYLASWGMYRGSSFLLQKDYRVHLPIVEEILVEKYDSLFGIDCDRLRQPDQQLLLSSLVSFMSAYYDSVRISVKGNEIKYKLSDTLITKVLMGTLGCAPAYDRFFVEGIKAHCISTGTFTMKSLLSLIDFYEANSERLEEARTGLKAYDLPYPQMKLLDMGFWQIGFEKDSATVKNGAKVVFVYKK